jgi:hypothetical protein
VPEKTTSWRQVDSLSKREKRESMGVGKELREREREREREQSFIFAKPYM